VTCFRTSADEGARYCAAPPWCLTERARDGTNARTYGNAHRFAHGYADTITQG
jgi:hypothetical protein